MSPERIAEVALASERLNLLLGGRGVFSRRTMPMARRAARILDEGKRKRHLRLLDLGCACGGLTRSWVLACRRAGRPFVVEAVEPSRPLAGYAGSRPGFMAFPEMNVAAAHPLSLGERERESSDVVACGVFAHRLEPEERVALLRVMGRLARAGFALDDWLRSPAASLAAKTFGSLSRDEAIRADLDAAIERAFTLEEWVEAVRRANLPGAMVESRMMGARVSIWWERLAPSPEPEETPASLLALAGQGPWGETPAPVI